MKAKIVAIIPARGGYKRIPKKNIKLLAGKPLIAHTIIAALGSKVDGVYVSTDDGDIAKASEEFGATVIKRPAELSTDKSSSESVLFHFIKKVDCNVLVFLQCTSPLMTPEDINGGLKLFSSGKFDSIVSVYEDHGGFSWDEKGKPINFDLSFKRRPFTQELKKAYRENGAFYIMTKEGLIKHKYRSHGRVGLYKMPSQRSVDIDTLADFELVEKLLK